MSLPDESGFEVCAALSETAQAPAVLLVSASDYGGCAVVALCGAKGFALKSDLVDIDLARYWPMTGAQRALSAAHGLGEARGVVTAARRCARASPGRRD